MYSTLFGFMFPIPLLLFLTEAGWSFFSSAMLVHPQPCPTPPPVSWRTGGRRWPYWWSERDHRGTRLTGRCARGWEWNRCQRFPAGGDWRVLDGEIRTRPRHGVQGKRIPRLITCPPPGWSAGAPDPDLPRTRKKITLKVVASSVPNRYAVRGSLAS